MYFSGDGASLISSSDDDQIVIYDCERGTQKRTLNSRKYGVDLIHFTQNKSNVSFWKRRTCTYMTDTSRNYYIDIHATFLNQLHVLFRWYMHQPKKTTLSDTWMSVKTSTSSTFGDTIKGSSHYAWIPPMTPSSQAHLTKVFVSGISGNYTCAFECNIEVIILCLSVVQQNMRVTRRIVLPCIKEAL